MHWASIIPASTASCRRDFQVLDPLDFLQRWNRLARRLDSGRIYRHKYRVDDVSRVLYGLSYFEDAEAEPMPQVLVDLDWNEVKTTIKQWVKDLA